jgi:hypothetical protein
MNREVIVETEELSPLQKRMVRDTLRSILESPQFSKSKRYPALLEHIVIRTLSGESETLKERLLATEVFDRPAGYDSTTDAIVRTIAGEVRRRMAAYFSEHPDAPVRIELPLGGYIPEFRFQPPAKDDSPALEARRELVDSISAREVTFIEPERPERLNDSRSWRGIRVIALGVLLMAIAGVTLWAYIQNRAKRDFWSPILHSGEPVMVVIGKHGDPAPAGTNSNDSAATLPGRSSVVLQDVRAVAQICSALHEIENDCDIASASSVTLEDFRGKSVVLLGAYNNPWTRPLLASLPFQIPLENPAPSSGYRRRIVEHKNTGETPIAVMGEDIPGAALSSDYAIIGRFQSSVTKSMVVVIAGLGPEGTRGAAEFVSSPDQMAHLVSLAQRGWSGINFEAVLQVDVLQSSAGSSKVIGAQFW